MGALDAIERKPTAAELEQLFLQVLEDGRFQEIGPWELTEHGEIVVSPVSGRHNRAQTKLSEEIERQLGGAAWGEQGIRRADGPPIVPDVMWGSRAFFEAHQDSGLLPAAPPLCIEIMSPSNSIEQLRHKCQIYLGLGAEEAWIVEPISRVTEMVDTRGAITESKFGFDLAKFWATL